ncbi:hypothetical protein [Hephaestia mangrovi]|uniref:hypothetical protein n=1 Tax=Hephaestia mangrovi TaxID=2873268 RepID=UPI001CA618AB|nr:hypothetical protein [Hephaestia mangrovi]MBY8829251.1 hypothetical protein [Hephaestia mangrovi]
MRALLLLALLAAPALADDPAAHSGVAKVRTGPAASDIALFVMAAIGVWLARRAMIRRAQKRRED